MHCNRVEAQPAAQILAMTSHNPSPPLPDKSSSNLHLGHPTPGECLKIWTLTSSAWRDALTVPQYLEESEYLLTVPLAKDGGMTVWILVEEGAVPERRAILASCETFHKRVFVKGKEGGMEEGIVHGVASVYCDPEYRGRGYASRMMKGLAAVLRTWQCDEGNKVFGSILYSDIGRKYYSDLGWHAVLNNVHVSFPAGSGIVDASAVPLLAGDLESLCEIDESFIRKEIEESAEPCFAVIPDHDNILWHHAKEEFTSQKLFGKMPTIKGAITGPAGKRVWLIWTHRFYSDPKGPSSDNTLYILRLGIEDPPVAEKDTYWALGRSEVRRQLKSLISCAKEEAIKWDLHSVKLWNPDTQMIALLKDLEIPHRVEDRQLESIASVLWYGNDGPTKHEIPQWKFNEKFAWC